MIQIMIRRQAIVWTNGGPIYWHIEALGLNELRKIINEIQIKVQFSSKIMHLKMS